jgi:TatD DNase family protein
MELIDIGINLMHRSFGADREGVLQAAGDAGVRTLIITGANERSSREAADYAERYNRSHPEGPVTLYATAGVHPHDAKTCGPGTLGELRGLAEYKAAAAIGECGLDYNRDFSPRPVQREWFEKQIALAGELKLPLFLHERDAFEDFSAILENNRGGPKMVVHCFTGTEGELMKYLDLGCYIGITGWICDERRGRHLAALAGKIPPDRLMIETDAPFLIPRDLPAPAPGRSGRNEPKYLPHIAAAIARYAGKTAEEVAAESTANARRFFGI